MGKANSLFRQTVDEVWVYTRRFEYPHLNVGTSMELFDSFESAMAAKRFYGNKGEIRLVEVSRATND